MRQDGRGGSEAPRRTWRVKCKALTPNPRLLAQTGLVASMSRKGNCYDNAVVESFFSTLKNELIHDGDYHTRDEARTEVFEFIEGFYNRQRLHQTLGYVSPVQFETHNAVPLRGCLRNRG